MRCIISEDVCRNTSEDNQIRHVSSIFAAYLGEVCGDGGGEVVASTNLVRVDHNGHHG